MYLLFLSGSFNRAARCASTAANALISVDLELTVVFRDALNGALVSASAATNALFLVDYKCHFVFLHYLYFARLFYQILTIKSIAFCKKLFFYNF